MFAFSVSLHDSKLRLFVVFISFFISISLVSDSFCIGEKDDIDNDIRKFSSARKLMFDYKLNSALTAFSGIKKPLARSRYMKALRARS